MFGKDKRSEKRRECEIKAALVGARPKLFPCEIKNLSGRGAKIAISGDWVLPAMFSLTGSNDRRDMLDCRLIWRRGNFAGVRLSPRVE